LIHYAILFEVATNYDKDFDELLKFQPSHKTRQQRVPLPSRQRALYSMGSGSRTSAYLSARHLPQRAMVKVSYGPPRRLKSHIDYLQREGAGLDGKKAELFTEQGKDLPTEKIESENHVFRLILSPENGKDIHDMQEYTRNFMHQVNKDRSADLQWFATVHYNTANPHSHIVIRGIDSRHQEVKLDRSFISVEARQIASKLATMELGYRKQNDINAQVSRELVSDRFTSIDRRIYIYSSSEKTLRAVPRDQLEKERLEYLSTKLNLAHRINRTDAYQLDPHWKQTLEYNGRQEDIIKTIYHDLPPDLRKQWIGPGTKDHLSVYRNTWTVEGKVVSAGLADEMTDRAYLLIESKGRQYFYSNAKLNLSEHRLGDQVRIECGKFSNLTKEKDIGGQKQQGKDLGIEL